MGSISTQWSRFSAVYNLDSNLPKEKRNMIAKDIRCSCVRRLAPEAGRTEALPLISGQHAKSR